MKTKFTILLFVLFSFFACNQSDPDPCDSTAASQKVINIKANVVIESESGIPVANQPVFFTIKLIRCSQEETLYDFTDSTDQNGILSSEICNFVLNNTKDQIVLYAIAHNLPNFVNNNFQQKIIRYNEFTGFGLEEYDLTILTQD